MSNYFLPLILCIIAAGYPIVLGLEAEGIISGRLAEQSDFKYQVAIFAKARGCRNYNLICAGGIIGNRHVLSVAQCFSVLVNNTFAIAAGTDDLKKPGTVKIVIDTIYVPYFDNLNALDKIAVLKLRGSFHLDGNSILASLHLPNFHDRFYLREAVVAGYGSYWTSTIVDDLGRISRYRGGTDYLLRYTKVNVAYQFQCNNVYHTINFFKELCGLAIADSADSHMGVCTRDYGSPLVVDNTVIGLVNHGTPDCNDAVFGAIYTKVSYYRRFIEMVLNETLTPGIVILYNYQNVS